MATANRDQLIKFKHDFAILVGIEDYAFAPLQTPVNDIRVLKEVLIEHQGYKAEEILLLENPSQLLLEELFRLLAKIKAEHLAHPEAELDPKIYQIQLNNAENDREKDRAMASSIHDFLQLYVDDLQSGNQVVEHQNSLLFFYAGHGVAGDMGENEIPVGYFLARDAHFQNRQIKDNDSLTPMETIFDGIEAMDCHHTLLILDCCFAGSFRNMLLSRDISVGIKLMSKQRFQQYKDKAAWQVLASAGPDEKAFDLIIKESQGTDRRHSPFAQALIDTLSGTTEVDAKPAGRNLGDGVLTAQEISIFLRDEVRRLTKKHQLKDQTPDIFPAGKKHIGGQFIFFNPKHPFNLDQWLDLKFLNPYAGLRPMDVDQGNYFFGRKKELVQLKENLSLQKFGTETTIQIVTGPSGSGKSSIVKAGLFHVLLEEEDVEIFQLRPSKRPWTLQQLDRENKAWQDIIQIAQPHFLQFADSTSSKVPFKKDRKQILLVDQFEEIYTACTAEERIDLESKLLALAKQAIKLPFVLIFTIRSDYNWQFELSPLGQPFWTKEGKHYDVLKVQRLTDPSLESLRQAMVQPAQLTAYEFQGNQQLVDMILEDLDYVPNALPLLSYTMRQMVEKTDKSKRLFLHETYESELGGVQGVISKKMESIYQLFGSSWATDGDDLEAPVHRQEMLRKLMIRLVEVEDGGYTKRKVYRSQGVNELNFGAKTKYLDEVLDILAKIQFIYIGGVKDEDLSQETTPKGQYIELVHDALINTWSQGKQWINDFGKDKLLIQRQLWQAILDCYGEKEYRDGTNESLVGQKDGSSFAIIPEFTELWNNNPKLQQIIDDLIDWSDIEGLRTKIEQYLQMPSSGEDEVTLVRQSRLLDLLDPRRQVPSNLSLNNFILDEGHQVFLKAVFESGDHWLNEHEAHFLLKSWEKRAEDVQNINQASPSPDEFLRPNLMDDSSAKKIIQPSWKALERVDPKAIKQEEELLHLKELYLKLRLVLDFPRLQPLLPFPIFLSGPHTEDINFNAKQFGHYNPSFWDWIRQNALPQQSDTLYWKTAKLVYDRFFQDQVRLHYAALKNLEINTALKEKIQNGYEALLATKQSTDGYFSQELHQAFSILPPYVEAILQKTRSPQYSYALGFWIRRSVDGSYLSCKALIEAVVERFDPAIL